MSLPAAEKPLVATVNGQRQERPPIWIMRQAGRYLPEYREVRAGVKDFLELCYTPKLAAEVTLQPLRRFDLDAAILFSDILVIPDALGQRVQFEEGEGPRLEPITAMQIGKLRADKVVANLGPVLETLGRIEAALSPHQALIGFCGAPWTVATYMIGGKGSSDQAAARTFALTEPEAFRWLLDVLVDASAAYLIAQLNAGADVVQIFESWAQNLDEVQFSDWVIDPARKIVEKVRAAVPSAPIIGFPRGAAGMIPAYAQRTGVSAIGLDYAVPLAFANETLHADLPVQGNLDPIRLLAGGMQMESRTRDIIAAFSGRPHIFNLGHGILPATPIEHVSRLVDIVKGR